jgi:hypothetical protein
MCPLSERNEDKPDDKGRVECERRKVRPNLPRLIARQRFEGFDFRNSPPNCSMKARAVAKSEKQIQAQYSRLQAVAQRSRRYRYRCCDDCENRKV